MATETAISRDPFARTELMRQSVISTDGCTNCGGQRTPRQDGQRKLFQYGTARDGISASYTATRWHEGLFCGKSCHDSYHS
jgi:hypothetical protein